MRGLWCSQLTCRLEIAGRLTAPGSPRQRLAGKPPKNINAPVLGQWPLELRGFCHRSVALKLNLRRMEGSMDLCQAFVLVVSSFLRGVDCFQ